MSAEAALLRETARIQHQKTLLDVRDIIDAIPVTEYDQRSYGQKSLPAKGFRDALLSKLKAMRIEEGQ